MTILNAFTSVRPRGPDLDLPAAQQKKGAGKPLTVNTRKALDRAGRPIVDLAPRTTGGHRHHVAGSKRGAAGKEPAHQQGWDKAGA